MNTNNLAVGQKIQMRSGDQFKEAVVTEITEKYVAVEPAPVGTELKYIIRFDKSGKQPFWDGLSVWGGFCVWEYIGDTLGWWQEDRRPLCGEGGHGEPWRLVEY